MDVAEAMEAAGWSYEGKTNGFKKLGVGWVSYEQAERALAAAEAGTMVEAQRPVSRTVAAILSAVANE
jgi:hypothetical protein